MDRAWTARETHAKPLWQEEAALSRPTTAPAGYVPTTSQDPWHPWPSQSCWSTSLQWCRPTSRIRITMEHGLGTLGKAGLDLRTNSFTHSQLYTRVSRVCFWWDIQVLFGAENLEKRRQQSACIVLYNIIARKEPLWLGIFESHQFTDVPPAPLGHGPYLPSRSTLEAWNIDFLPSSFWVYRGEYCVGKARASAVHFIHHDGWDVTHRSWPGVIHRDFRLQCFGINR